MFESQNPEKINIKNLSFEESEKEGKTPEELREEFRDLLVEKFSSWYSHEVTKAKISEAAGHLPELITPKDQNWQAKEEEAADPSKFGEYTLNPETVDIDWETIPIEKIKSVKLPDELNDKLLSDIAKHVVATYGDNYYIPGIEYWKYILEHHESCPQELKDGNPHYFFGSVLRGASGNWFVPRAWWLGTNWNQRRYLTAIFSDYRAVLVEKSAVARKPGKDFSKPTPPMPEVRKF